MPIDRTQPNMKQPDRTSPNCSALLLTALERSFQPSSTAIELDISCQELQYVCLSILETLLGGQASSLMNSLVLGTHVPIGSRLLATKWVVDPAQAAFQHALLLAWNGRSERLYPGHNVLSVWAGVLPMADYLSRKRVVRGQEPITFEEVLALMNQLRRLYKELQQLWSGPQFQRWHAKLLVGAGCLKLMHRSDETILALWTHLTYAGLGQSYPLGATLDKAWAEGLDLHQTIMAAYSVVQTHSLSVLSPPCPPLEPSQSPIALTPTLSIEQIQQELRAFTIQAQSHPDLGACHSLCFLSQKELWSESISEFYSRCAL